MTIDEMLNISLTNPMLTNPMLADDIVACDPIDSEQHSEIEFIRLDVRGNSDQDISELTVYQDSVSSHF